MADSRRAAQERFGANVERLRRQSRISLEGLAERSEVDRARLEAILSGSEEAGAGVIYRIAGALGVQPGDLFEGITWVPPDGANGGYVVEDPDA